MPRKAAWDERWCLVALREPHEVIAEQCPHDKAPGRYCVESRGELCVFDPPTKLQALSWVNGKQERRERIRWLCGECGKAMPLSSYAAD